MTNTAAEIQKEGFNVNNLRNFPCIRDGKINVLKFLDATSDLILLIDKLGSALAPVKYDMQGNINKIKKNYVYNEDSCLLALMLDEKSKGKLIAAEGVLWLNRALFFFELVFQEIIECLKRKEYDLNIQYIFVMAYDTSVKKYHGWVTQKLFRLILRISPTLPQILKTLDAEKDIKQFEIKLTNLHSSINSIRRKIDDFFHENNLFEQIQ